MVLVEEPYLSGERGPTSSAVTSAYTGALMEPSERVLIWTIVGSYILSRLSIDIVFI